MLASRRPEVLGTWRVAAPPTGDDDVTLPARPPQIRGHRGGIDGDVDGGRPVAGGYAGGDAEPPLVVLDLTHVEFFSSSFIELMFRLLKRLKSRGGKLAICNLHPYCREVLEITNLHTLWPLADTREEAITELKSAN